MFWSHHSSPAFEVPPNSGCGFVVAIGYHVPMNPEQLRWVLPWSQWHCTLGARSHRPLPCSRTATTQSSTIQWCWRFWTAPCISWLLKHLGCKIKVWVDTWRYQYNEQACVYLVLCAVMQDRFKLPGVLRFQVILGSIWVCLKMGYTPNYSHLIGIMIIDHWVIGYTIFRQTHIRPSNVQEFPHRLRSSIKDEPWRAAPWILTRSERAIVGWPCRIPRVIASLGAVCWWKFNFWILVIFPQGCKVPAPLCAEQCLAAQLSNFA